jgi:hypothetical protein
VADIDALAAFRPVSPESRCACEHAGRIKQLKIATFSK